MTSKDCAACPYYSRKNKVYICEFFQCGVGQILHCKLSNNNLKRETE
nr:MAG TPA: hypothetical protein [Caudoviricetes sp.]